MLYACNLGLLIIQIVFLFLAIKALKKDYLNFASYFYILYFVFFIPVFWDIFTESFFFHYIYKIVSEYNINATKLLLTYYNFISTSIMVMYWFGYNIAIKKTITIVKRSYNEKRYILLQILLFFFWLLLFYLQFRKFDGNIIQFLMPSTKNFEVSSYIKTLSISIPISMFTLTCIKDVYKYGKISKYVIIYMLFVILSTFPTAQRREMIEAIIYMALVLLFSNKKIIMEKLVDLKMQNKKNFSKMRKLLIFSLIFVALFWYARVYFSQIADNTTEIINPLKLRNPLEVIYGSGASGYPTLLAMHNFFEIQGMPYFRNVLYILTIIIPRSVYPNKVIVLTEYMQVLTNAKSNLSLFYIADLYFTFGIASILISLIFGYFFSLIYNRSNKSLNLSEKYISYLMMSKIILLFKNGMFEYLIMIFFYIFVCKICVNFVFIKNRGESENE